MLKKIFSFLKVATLSFVTFSLLGIFFLYLWTVFTNTGNEVQEMEKIKIKQTNVETSKNNIIKNNIVDIESYKDEVLKDIENLRLMLTILNKEDDDINKEIDQYESLVLNYNPRNNIDLIVLDYLDFKKLLIKSLQEELIVENKGN